MHGPVLAAVPSESREGRVATRRQMSPRRALGPRRSGKRFSERGNWHSAVLARKSQPLTAKEGEGAEEKIEAVLLPCPWLPLCQVACFPFGETRLALSDLAKIRQVVGLGGACGPRWRCGSGGCLDATLGRLQAYRLDQHNTPMPCYAMCDCVGCEFAKIFPPRPYAAYGVLLLLDAGWLGLASPSRAKGSQGRALRAWVR